MTEEEKLNSFNEQNGTKIKIDDKNITLEQKSINESSLIKLFSIKFKNLEALSLNKLNINNLKFLSSTHFPNPFSDTNKAFKSSKINPAPTTKSSLFNFIPWTPWAVLPVGLISLSSNVIPKPFRVAINIFLFPSDFKTEINSSSS